MAQVPTLPDGTPVAVELFSTSILSNHKVRAKHERFVSVLNAQRIPFVVHDLASDPAAKSRWRRKALIDSSIPGLLVHNEWRGTYEEFHEAVEFGELHLFLRIDQDRLAREATAAGLEETTTDSQPPAVAKASGEKGIDFIPPPLAPEGSGARPEPDADETLLSLGLSGIKLSDADVDKLLAEVDAPHKPSAPKDPVYTVAGDRIAARTYIPSANAGVKPLRLPRMPSASATTSATPSLPRASSAKYNASHHSSAALAAEAKATIKPRRSQGGRVASVVRDGADLPTALANVRDHVDQHVAGRETADDLFASLGLNDLTMTDAEAEAFLETGEIPDTLINPEQDKRWLSEGDKARHEAAARDLAGRKRDLGYGLSPAAQTSRRLSHTARTYMGRSTSASSVSGTSPVMPVTAEAAEVESPVQSASSLPSAPDEGDTTAVDLEEVSAEKTPASRPAASDAAITSSGQSNGDESKVQVSQAEEAAHLASVTVPSETDKGPSGSDVIGNTSDIKDPSSDTAAPQDVVEPVKGSFAAESNGVKSTQSVSPKGEVPASADLPKGPSSPPSPKAVIDNPTSVSGHNTTEAESTVPGAPEPTPSNSSPVATPVPRDESAGKDVTNTAPLEQVRPAGEKEPSSDSNQPRPTEPLPTSTTVTAAAPAPCPIVTPATPAKSSAALPSTVEAPAPAPAATPAATPPTASAPEAASAPAAASTPTATPAATPAAASPPAAAAVPAPVPAPATASSPASLPAEVPSSLEGGIRGPSYSSRSTSKQSLIDLFPPSKKRVGSGASSPMTPGTPRDISRSPTAPSPTFPPPSPSGTSPSASSASQRGPSSSFATSSWPAPRARDSASSPAAGQGHQRTLSEILRMADDVIAGNGGDDDLGLDSSLVNLL